jgi:hypothetical protein
MSALARYIIFGRLKSQGVDVKESSRRKLRGRRGGAGAKKRRRLLVRNRAKGEEKEAYDC